MDHKFYFVDLPGYGYSKMSKEEQIKCGKFIEDYLQKRENICLVILLLDIRHMPTQDDVLMYDYLIHTSRPFIVVTNKADKIAVTKVDAQVQTIQENLNPLKDIAFFPFSSERKIYTETVWEKIEEFL